LDAESETLVNQALNTLLEGNNTTISIAHRLSTIKRSDMIICIGNDGRVAETGTYKELSVKKTGAFSKLMEWQMSGDAAAAGGSATRRGGNREGGAKVSEEEELEYSLEREENGEDEEELGREFIGEQGTRYRGKNVTAAEAVAERTSSSSSTSSAGKK
jgi:putative ABC transport system ATP-binding protein